MIECNPGWKFHIYTFRLNGVIIMNNIPSIEFLSGWQIVLYFLVLISQLHLLYSNANKGKSKLAIGNVAFILVFSYLYLSKYYTLK